MKKFALKNQVIITSLAILIAVAGYLNYSENNLKDITIKSKTEKSEPANEKVLKNIFCLKYFASKKRNT